jgi:hypothetical protein
MQMATEIKYDQRRTALVRKRADQRSRKLFPANGIRLDVASPCEPPD